MNQRQNGCRQKPTKARVESEVWVISPNPGERGKTQWGRLKAEILAAETDSAEFGGQL
jgi:hypothetical protein